MQRLIDWFDIDANRERVGRYGLFALAAIAIVALVAGFIPRAHAADKGGDKGKIADVIPGVVTSPWTGCYVGGALGYEWTRTDIDAVIGGSSTLSAADALVTVGGGCSAQVGVGAVLGLQADVSWSNLDKAWASGSALEANWQWYVGAYGGFLITPKTLIFASLGYTSLDGGFTFNETTSFSDLKGLTVGGGVEHMFSGGWSVKGEYRYVSYGRDTAPEGKIDGLVDGSHVDSGAHQFRLGLNKRF